jgi:hypothetical protein
MVVGSLLAGFMNQYLEPKWCFLVYSSCSIFVSAAAVNLSREIDTKDADKLTGFCKDLGRSIVETFKGIGVKEIYMTVLYMIVSNAISPSFGEFGFYYNTNVRHISKTTIGFLDTLGSFSNLAGVLAYTWWFTNIEYRTMLLWGTYIGFVGSILCIGFILEYNKQIGISDEVYLYVTTVIFSAVYISFTMLPMAVLFVKITPKSIEGTIYAILIGT